ncbi:hypothetical protein HELRODRAFT_84554, partial [Helobdella robusta]|uniref:NWD1/2-like winged helix-turn-helix domain-containing protein n=1 Tax=Helobdella robusta TaxID=6412 RepID=T1G5K3_HELRO
MATLDRPLILLLDSLDQVNTNHRAHNLAWLPHSLPQHVHVIITTLPNAYDILPTLKKLIERRENFFEVVSLGSNLCVDIVKRHLEDRKRSLTDEQLKIVHKTFGTCTIPLYTALVSKEVDRWASYDQPDPIASTCEGIICNLFQRVEAYYGAILVKHFFSYISASKCGLSCAELEDVLSLDDVVLNDVFQHWVPPTRRIPPLLLLRLKDEMSNYIVEREANGVSVIYWYHNKFLQVCKRRYLSNVTFSRYIHTLLAHFYLGTWSGEKPKP